MNGRASMMRKQLEVGTRLDDETINRSRLAADVRLPGTFANTKLRKQLFTTVPQRLAERLIDGGERRAVRRSAAMHRSSEANECTCRRTFRQKCTTRPIVTASNREMT